MKPKILSWNVRGLNKEEKHLRIRNLLKEWKADVTSLQETKMEIMSYSIGWRDCSWIMRSLRW
jgi:exonuclease III